MKNELVLCVHKDYLHVPLKDIPDEAFSLISREFVEKPELGTTFIQAIASLVLVKEDSADVLSYTRAGSEERLKGKKSILLGGHVNLEDVDCRENNVMIKETEKGRTTSEGVELFRAVIAGAIREFKEETGIDDGVSLFPKLTLYTDEDEVSSVHTGFVFLGTKGHDEELKLSDEIGSYEWVNPTKLTEEQLNEYEPWSRITLEYLKSVLAKRADS